MSDTPRTLEAMIYAEGKRTRMEVPDPEMTAYELATLRVMNGEAVPGWVSGAAANICAAWLKACGYAEGHNSITQKGRDYLSALDKAPLDE